MSHHYCFSMFLHSLALDPTSFKVAREYHDRTGFGVGEGKKREIVCDGLSKDEAIALANTLNALENIPYDAANHVWK